jgi:hypothetical protein
MAAGPTAAVTGPCAEAGTALPPAMSTPAAATAMLWRSRVDTKASPHPLTAQPGQTARTWKEIYLKAQAIARKGRTPARFRDGAVCA